MGRTPSKLLASPTHRFSGISYSMDVFCIALCRGTNKPAPMIAGVVGTACQAVLLTTVACLHIAAASSATGGLSALPRNFQGEHSDRNAGLQAWGHLLGSAVLFNKVYRQFLIHVASSHKQELTRRNFDTRAHIHTALFMAVMPVLYLGNHHYPDSESFSALTLVPTEIVIKSTINRRPPSIAPAYREGRALLASQYLAATVAVTRSVCFLPPGR